MTSRIKTWRKISFFVVWIVLVMGGFWKLLVYSNTPGTQSPAPVAWPLDSLIPREPGLPTLLVFAHPHCPCSEATMGELERLAPHIKNKIVQYVLFFNPKNHSENWAKDKLWKQAKKIPEVHKVIDEDGQEAARFNAQTSGQVLLYDKKGDLVFRGGITPARGHRGDNDGRSAILSFINEGQILISSTHVFGCSLKKPERQPAGKGDETEE